MDGPPLLFFLDGVRGDSIGSGIGDKYHMAIQLEKEGEEEEIWCHPWEYIHLSSPSIGQYYVFFPIPSWVA